MTQHQRIIVSGHSTTTLVSVDTMAVLHDWLAAQTFAYKLQWLLLHADSGVVWGEQRGDKLIFSAPATALRWNMLHQARLFSEHGELFVWRGPQGWQARLIHDNTGEVAEWIDEKQLLWGNRPVDNANNEAGFTVITEGAQGITHAPPIGNAISTDRQRAQLLVRHYIGEDDAGVVRISRSRVVKLLKPGEEI